MFPARLWAMADLYTPMAVRVAATLGLAEHVAAGAPVADMAEQVGADPDALVRLVDRLVDAGVFARDDAGALSLTDLGEELLAGREWLDISGALGRADLSAVHLLESVRTGRPAYPLAYGRGFWDDLAADPALGRSYDALMGARIEVGEVVGGYDWGALHHVVDVGGGTGALLAAILAANPGLRGTLVDLPGAIEASAAVLAGVADRCESVARSFFEPLPRGGDAYVVSAILHSWSDDDATLILRRCVEAGAERVLLIEDLAEEGASSEMDLRMLAYTGGRERSLEQLDRLAARAGLRLAGVHRVARHRTIVDLRA